MQMPWTHARCFLQTVRAYKVQEFKDTAIAARAAWLEEKDWEKWIKSVG